MSAFHNSACVARRVFSANKVCQQTRGDRMKTREERTVLGHFSEREEQGNEFSAVDRKIA